MLYGAGFHSKNLDFPTFATCRQSFAVGCYRYIEHFTGMD
jgi:hypothetical protein